jgi:hypothetical protein
MIAPDRRYGRDLERDDVAEEIVVRAGTRPPVTLAPADARALAGLLRGDSGAEVVAANLDAAAGTAAVRIDVVLGPEAADRVLATLEATARANPQALSDALLDLRYELLMRAELG